MPPPLSENGGGGGWFTWFRGGGTSSLLGYVGQVTSLRALNITLYHLHTVSPKYVVQFPLFHVHMTRHLGHTVKLPKLSCSYHGFNRLGRTNMIIIQLNTNAYIMKSGHY